jgi:hypothetical protein
MTRRTRASDIALFCMRRERGLAKGVSPTKTTNEPAHAQTGARSGEWEDEDYDLLADCKVVGRILEEEGSRFGPPELRWDGRSSPSCRGRRA